MQTRRFLTLALLLGLASLALPRAAIAQTPPTYCGPADVAFVIDDTWSMTPDIPVLKSRISEILNVLETTTDPSTVGGPDYRLALVTVETPTTISVRLNFGPQNSAEFLPLIQQLDTAGQGIGSGHASDEALNAVINGLAAAGRPKQTGDFTSSFRSQLPSGVPVRKLIVLITNHLPGGFDADYQFGVDDVNAGLRADEAAAAGIKIVAILSPINEATQAAATTMQQYAQVTGGYYSRTDEPMNTDAVTLIRDYLTSCTEANRAPVAQCTSVAAEASNAPTCTAPASIDAFSWDWEDEIAGALPSLSQNPAGPYRFGTTDVTLTATDSAGLTATCSSVVTVTCPGDAPPTVQLNALPAKVIGVVPVTATAHDDFGLTQVEFFADGNSIGVATAAPFGVQWDPVDYPPGSSSVLWAVAKDSNGQTTVSTAVTVIVGAPITSVIVQASHTSPQVPGTSVTFTAAATGGVGPLQFKFWIYDGTRYTLGRDWSTAATFTWTPATANAKYEVGVWARSAGNPADAPERQGWMRFGILSVVLTSATVTADKTAPQAAGTAITFTATATGGTAPYQFKFWIYDGTRYTLGRDWSAAPTFTWTPATANLNYQVGVWARSAGDTADAPERQGWMRFGILNVVLTSATLTANKTAPQVIGTAVTFTAIATGGTAPYQFKFWIYDGTAYTLGRDWSTATTFTWAPATVNPNYQVGVWARSAGNTADAPERQGWMRFGILSVVLTNAMVTANKAAPQVIGTPVTFTAIATGGTAPYQFKFWIYDGTTYTLGRDWSTAATFTWTPATANPSYQVGVWARSAGNSADAPERQGWMRFGILGVVLTSVTVTADKTAPQGIGTAVTFTAIATGGTAPYQFKFWIFDGTTYTLGRDWSAATTFTWTPPTANANYEVGVWARSAGNTADAPERQWWMPFRIVSTP